MSEQKPPEPIVAPDAPPAALEHAVTTAPAPGVVPRIERPTKAETIHIKRAWGGVMNVEEAWADGLPLNAKCEGCAAPRKMVRLWVRTYLPLPDFHRAVGPVGAMLHMQKFEGRLPILETIHGPMVFVKEAMACSMCAPALEKAAAQHPSYALCEIRRPPKAKTQVQVPRGPRV